MEGMLQNNAASQNSDTLLHEALELGKLLDEHRGEEVVVMDMRKLNFWTDFFIIATVTSGTHLAGLERHIKDFTREKGLEILRHSQRPAKDAEQSSGEWRLLDIGGMVIHLMSARTRAFFELERLWSAAPFVFKAEASAKETTEAAFRKPESGE